RKLIKHLTLKTVSLLLGSPSSRRRSKTRASVRIRNHFSHDAAGKQPPWNVRLTVGRVRPAYCAWHVKTTSVCTYLGGRGARALVPAMIRPFNIKRTATIKVTGSVIFFLPQITQPTKTECRRSERSARLQGYAQYSSAVKYSVFSTRYWC